MPHHKTEVPSTSRVQLQSFPDFACEVVSNWDLLQMLKQEDLSCDNQAVIVVQPMWYVG